MSGELPLPGSDDLPATTVRRRAWSKKFQDALRGLKLGVRGHSSFFVHFFVAIVVCAAGITLRMSVTSWCILLGCITAVLAAELFNSAIEILCRTIDIERLPNGKAPLDIAAGAVLAVSIGAAVIGSMIFAARIIELFG